MLKHKTLMLLSASMVLLASCGQKVTYKDHLEDYVFTMQYHKNFNILQLTDIHWSATTSTISSKAYLDKVIVETDRYLKSKDANAKIDLVELTGDMFMLSNAYHVDTFLSFMEEKSEQYGFKYASIWGNHDHHGVFNPNWLGEKFAKAKNSLYYEPNDDLYGRSNFVINLTEDGTKATSTRWQLANLDSGASFSETAVSPFRDYDYIRPEQTKWWVAEHEAVGENVPGIAYYHIPQDENLKAYKERASLKNKFFKLESFADNGNEKYESDFIDVAKDHNLKGAFMGHAHNVDWTVEYEGVVIGLGVKSGPELYYAHIDVNSEKEDVKEGLASIGGASENFDLIGASLVTLTDEENAADNERGNFDLEHLYYNERSNGNDYARWVKW